MITQTNPAHAVRNGIHTLTGVQILAVDACVPDQVITNQDLALLGYDEQWIVQRTGIHERRRAAPDCVTSDIACEAARRCLERTGHQADEIDLIVFATVTPDTVAPAAACHLQRRLGCHAPAMDLNAGCSGFVFGLITAAQFVKSGFSKLALVAGADLMQRVVNPEERQMFPLFGDGGGVVLVGPGTEKQGLLSYQLGTDGEGTELLSIPGTCSSTATCPDTENGARQFLHMDGKPVFKWAVRTVADSIREVVRGAQLSLPDISLFVLHQANLRILDAVAEDLEIEREKMIVNVDRYGNTSAGSIPLALAEADEQGRLQRDDLVVLCGFGAGLTWGSAVVHW